MIFCASENEDHYDDGDCGDNVEELLSRFDGKRVFVGVRKGLEDATPEELEFAEGEGLAWLADRVQVFTRDFDFTVDEDGVATTTLAGDILVCRILTDEVKS